MSVTPSLRSALAALFIQGGAALLLACAPAQAGGAVCITGDIGVGDLKPGACLSAGDVASLMDRPVGQGGQSGGLKLTHPDDIARQETVTTCRQYDNLKSKNWYALTGADMAAESWFERTCGALRMIAAAKASSRSFLDTPDSGFADPAFLGASLLPDNSDGGSASSGSLADLVKQKKVEIQQAERRRLELTYGGQSVIYDELARGDFNGDGTEDELVCMGVHNRHGSLAWFRDITLSRKAGGARLEAVD